MSNLESILIIDDEPNLRHLYSKLLTLEGYDVDNASDGSEGLKLLERKHYSLVITDIKLPDINGLQVIAKVKIFTQTLK